MQEDICTYTTSVLPRSKQFLNFSHVFFFFLINYFIVQFHVFKVPNYWYFFLPKFLSYVQAFKLVYTEIRQPAKLGATPGRIRIGRETGRAGWYAAPPSKCSVPTCSLHTGSSPQCAGVLESYWYEEHTTWSYVLAKPERMEGYQMRVLDKSCHRVTFKSVLTRDKKRDLESRYGWVGFLRSIR